MSSIRSSVDVSLRIAALVAATGVASVASSACERRSSESGERPPPTSATATKAAAPTTFMVRHEVLALQTRDALTRGDLKATARFARDLARVRMSPEDAEFGERLIDMHIAAIDVSEAAQSDRPNNRDVSANAFGVLARTCADCHARLTGPTRLGESGQINDGGVAIGSRRTSTMRRHAFAMDRLWDGLVFNSEAPWREGASILSNRELMASDLMSSSKKTPVPEVEEAASAIGALSRKAVETSDVGERSKIFGRLVSACGACHERTGGGVSGGSTDTVSIGADK